MRMLVPLCLLMSLSLMAFSKKKKCRHVKYVSGTYSENRNGNRDIGRVYELTIKTLSGNVIADSVWFGYTPVPCDLLESATKHKTDTATQKGLYIVRVNRDLYANFSQQVDSGKAYTPAYTFRGDAVIMYTQNGKRYFLPVYDVKKIAPKPKRRE